MFLTPTAFHKYVNLILGIALLSCQLVCCALLSLENKIDTPVPWPLAAPPAGLTRLPLRGQEWVQRRWYRSLSCCPQVLRRAVVLILYTRPLGFSSTSYPLSCLEHGHVLFLSSQIRSQNKICDLLSITRKK